MDLSTNPSFECTQSPFGRKTGVDVGIVRARVNDDHNSFAERTADQKASKCFDRDLLKLFSSLLQQNLFRREFFGTIVPVSRDGDTAVVSNLHFLRGQRNIILIDSHVFLHCAVGCFSGFVDESVMFRTATVLPAKFVRSEFAGLDPVSLAETMEAEALQSHQFKTFGYSHMNELLTDPDVMACATTAVTNLTGLGLTRWDTGCSSSRGLRILDRCWLWGWRSGRRRTSLSRWLDSSICAGVRIAWSWFVIVGVWNVITPQNISRSRDFFYITSVGGGRVGLAWLSLSSIGLVVL